MSTVFYEYQRSLRNPGIPNDINTDMLTIRILPRNTGSQEATDALLASLAIGEACVWLDIDLKAGQPVQIQAQLTAQTEKVPRRMTAANIRTLLNDLDACARLYCLEDSVQEEIRCFVRELPRHYQHCRRQPLKVTINSAGHGQDSS